MKAYTYDEHGVYMSDIDCQLDPVQSQKDGKDIYLTPGNATLTPPPAFDPETEKAVWDGEAWTVEALPEPPEPGPEPEPAPTLEERVDTLETDVDGLTAAIEKGLAL